MSRERRLADTVFVFGGGASRADGLPSQAELLPAFYDLRSDSPAYAGTRELLTEFLADFYEIADPVGQPLPTLEHILGILEMPARLDVCYSGRFTGGYLRKVRAAVLRATLLTLEHLQRHSGSAVHREFIENLRELYPDLAGIHFVSLNYDTLLDDAVARLYPEVVLDYGLDLTNFSVAGDQGLVWERPAPGSGCNLLKVHGSLNFKFCPLCQSVELIAPEGGSALDGAWNEEEAAPVRGRHAEQATCPRDGTPTELLIAPPTLFKEFSNPALLELWRRARTRLLEAKRIVVVGYSLPIADLHIWQMLKNAIMAGRMERLVVIGSPGSEDDPEAVVQYRQLTGDVEYFAVGFEAFARDPRSFLGE